MKLKNEKLWNEVVELNSSDGYSKACVIVAEKTMQFLDAFEHKLQKGYYPNLNTAHGLVCFADHYVKAGGLSGFQGSQVALIIRDCHERGEEFYKSYTNQG